MKNKKINIITLIAIILFAASVYLIFNSENIIQKIIESNTISRDSKEQYKKIAQTILSIDSISLDTKIFSSPFFKKIETLPEFPIDVNSLFVFGKPDPFSGSYITGAVIQNGVVGGIRTISNTNAGSSSLIVSPRR